MTNSYRHTPIIGNTTSSSEKQDKRLCNRRLRHRIKQELLYPYRDIFTELKEVYNPWGMTKDGKHYFITHKHPKLMRK